MRDSHTLLWHDVYDIVETQYPDIVSDMRVWVEEKNSCRRNERFIWTLEDAWDVWISNDSDANHYNMAKQAFIDDWQKSGESKRHSRGTRPEYLFDDLTGRDTRPRSAIKIFQMPERERAQMRAKLIKLVCEHRADKIVSVGLKLNEASKNFESQKKASSVYQLQNKVVFCAI